jgi:hypothetical protein
MKQALGVFYIAYLLAQGGPLPGQTPEKGESKALDKSRFFAFVDREYIFTLEMVQPGIPIINFISMADKENTLLAKSVRLTLENRKAPAKFFVVDTGNPKEPVIVPSVRMRAKSSFGMRLQGEFEDAKEVMGVAVSLGSEELQFVPLTSFDFENLALKLNRLNLRSPDFTDDWRLLKLTTLGTRGPARRY